QYGFLGVLLIIVLLVVHDPERALKLKALLCAPLYFLFKLCSRGYIASQVGYYATQFIRKHVTDLLPSAPDVRIRIKWVHSPTDPVFGAPGTLILRLKETNDQTENILTAARASLPQVVCPSLRQHMDKTLSTAIDLTLLRKCSEKLGKHTRPVFHRAFYATEVADDPSVEQLFEKLVAIDRTGLFVSVFLEELNVLGDSLYSSGSTQDQTYACTRLLEFLLVLAQRGLHEEAPLEFHTGGLHLGVILLAQTRKAESEGVRPYVNRFDRNMRSGCDSVYIVAYPAATSFMKRVIRALAADERATPSGQCVLRGFDRGRGLTNRFAEIAVYRRNTLFEDTGFKEKVEAAGIVEGSWVEGTVLDVAAEVSLIDVSGLNGYIAVDECSWTTVCDCHELLEEDMQRTFLVVGVEEEKNRLALTLRDPLADPWKSDRFPSEKDVIEIDITHCTGNFYVGRYVDDIEVCVPLEEVSWLETGDVAGGSLVDTRQNVLVYSICNETHTILASIRRLVEDPWPQIQKRFPKGGEYRATVVAVTGEYVAVNLPGNILGRVPASEMRQGGHEY
ncbi:hypothetical protein LCGC14_2335670, partial [marine sediment metagenome]